MAVLFEHSVMHKKVMSCAGPSAKPCLTIFDFLKKKYLTPNGA